MDLKGCKNEHIYCTTIQGLFYYFIQEGETLPNVLSFPSRRPPERLIDFNYQHIITMS